MVLLWSLNERQEKGDAFSYTFLDNHKLFDQAFANFRYSLSLELFVTKLNYELSLGHQTSKNLAL